MLRYSGDTAALMRHGYTRATRPQADLVEAAELLADSQSARECAADCLTRGDADTAARWFLVASHLWSEAAQLVRNGGAL